MDDKLFSFILLNIFLCMISAKQYDLPDDPHVKRFIQENHLLQDGYHYFDLTAVQFTDGLPVSYSTLQRRRRSTDNVLPFHASFESFGQNFTFELQQSKLFSFSSKIVIRNGSYVESLSPADDADCFVYGRVTSHNGSASLHYCDGITGVFTADGSSYRIDTINSTTRREEKTLVSRLHESHTEYRGFGCGLLNDFEAFSRTSDGKQRLRRQASSTSVTIETAIYLDADSTNKLHESGLTTTEQKIRAILIKWNGVQAEYNKIEQYDVNIEIKLIEFWATDPDWLIVGTDTLTETLSSFTNGIKSNASALQYDLRFLYCADNDPVKDGYAWPASLCTTNGFAVAKFGSLFSFSLTTHEVGHTLGMTHDGLQNICVSPDIGLMVADGSVGYDWSSCSRQELDTFIQSGRSCLFEPNIVPEDVPTGLQGEMLTPYWQGIEYSKDEMCDLKTGGTGFWFRAFPYDWGECDIHSCIDMNPGESYGRMITFNPNVYGAYCGEGMMCISGQCQQAAESGLSDAILTVVEGGWGEWSSFSECSRPCGTGLRVRRRACDSPRPRNAECEGLKYDAEKCNTERCSSDSYNTAELIVQRASESCALLLDNGVLESTEYTDAGIAFWDGRIGQCEVLCQKVPGFTPPQYTRYGLMPDGTPCTQETYSMTYAEQKGFPRSRGVSGHCVLGYCEAFGCDDKPGGKIADGCGVCGGNETSCTIHEGVYTDPVDTGERSIVASLPVDAYRIQFYIDYPSMQDHYIELWSENDDALLAPYYTYLDDWDTTSSPKLAAGTGWSFLYYDQFLFADGPITEPVVIKLYNFGTTTNTGVTYGYSLPVEIQGSSSSFSTTTASVSGTHSTASMSASTSSDIPVSYSTMPDSTPTTSDSTTETSETTRASSHISSTTKTTSSLGSTSTVSSPSTITSSTLNSTTSMGRTRNPNCKAGSLQCYDGKCISYRNICDGIQDCAENEDETDYMDCSLYGRSGSTIIRFSLVTIIPLVVIPARQLLNWYL